MCPAGGTRDLHHVRREITRDSELAIHVTRGYRHVRIAEKLIAEKKLFGDQLQPLLSSHHWERRDYGGKCTGSLSTYRGTSYSRGTD
jgi:hypothetical protein